MRRRKLYWLSLALAVALAAAYGVHRELWDRYAQYRKSENTVRAVEREVNTLDTAITVVKGEAEKLDTDPIEMEKAIRRIKKLVRPGETVFRIEPSSPPDGKAAPASVKEEARSALDAGARAEGEQRSEKEP